MKKQFAQAALFKALFAVTLILAASLLVTCDGFLDTFQPEGGDEWTDVEYETIGAVGNQRVKSVKLYLKPDNLAGDVVPGPGTYGVKKSAEQRRIERALTVEGARMSHDYFEAVFMADATTVARAAWEIGQPAGISGVSRQTGTSYSTPAPGSGTGGTATTGSIIFVGRKTGKTLMGVGYLTHVNDKPITDATVIVDGGTNSVTFTVSPLATWIGFNGTGTNTDPYVPNTLRNDVNLAATIPGIDTELATFMTATGRSVNTTSGVHGPPAIADSGTRITTGEKYAPFAGVTFPMYYLPSAKAANWTATPDTITVQAEYLVGGLTADTIWLADPLFVSPNPYFANGSTSTNGTLENAVLVWGHLNGAGGWTETQPPTGTDPPARFSTADLKGGLQFIKRTPAFMFEGINYEITSTYTDKITQVNTIPIAVDTAFTGKMEITFTVRKGTSGGIFAITFQCPVYALTAIRAGNTGNLPPEKWFIRPDYSQYQYLLDNGKDSGGAVLLGTDVAGGADWIQINTQGIGFSNE